MTISITTPGVSAYFKEVDASHWQCLSTGHSIRFADLDFYKRYGGDALCGLTYLGLPTSDEVPLDAQGATQQAFERGLVNYDPKHVHDNPPGSGSVYLAHVASTTGITPGEWSQARDGLKAVATAITPYLNFIGNLP